MIPSTLRAIELDNFEKCKNLKRIEFMEGREVLGKDVEDTSVWNGIFRECRVEEIILPGTLREMSPNIFRDCDSLKTVRVAKGCSLDIRKFVGENVEVQLQ